MISVMLAAVVFAAAPSPAGPQPVLRRLDTRTLAQGDGPVVVSVRTNATHLKNAAAAMDHFSARVLAGSDTSGPWQDCASAPTAFCQYFAQENGVRQLRFDKMTQSGELQIRYGYADAAPSEPAHILIGAPPATSTLAAISKAFGGRSNATPSPPVALAMEIDVASQPLSLFETVRVMCASTPLYGNTTGTAIAFGGKPLVLKSGQILTAARATVKGTAGTLRSVDFGTRVYIDARCVRPQ
jgi:hypothetical protein